jgi:asparagine synthase (glutamine-hydrolysing)
LRDALLHCVPALVPATGKIVLQLSGGLDSSIIAAALATAGRRFSAVTFATRAADGDERVYARETAGRLGVELVELVEDESAPDFARPSAPSFRPPATALLRSYRRLVSDQLRAMGADWSVNGAGGDNIFASLNSAGPVLDALRIGGVRAAATAAADLGGIHNATRWHVLRLAARKARRRRLAPWPRELRFLHPAAVLADIDPHPWLPPPAGALPGKSEHVRSLIGIQHFLDADQDGPNGLFPLLAQPVVELCLSIPTHLWIMGGRDRAVARAAFRGLLPDPVLDRRGKGRLESLFVRGYMQSHSQLEMLLLDGELRAQGLIDAEAVSSYLRLPGEPRDLGYTRLLQLAAAETWLRSFAR